MIIILTKSLLIHKLPVFVRHVGGLSPKCAAQTRRKAVLKKSHICCILKVDCLSDQKVIAIKPI